MEILSVKQFSLRIGNEDKIVNGSFSVSPGDVVLLTGPNGCGKSTVIKILMGAALGYKDLEYSCAGAVYKDSGDILHSESANELFRRKVCYVSQEDEFETDSVFDCFVNSISYSVTENREKFVLDFVRRFGIPECFSVHANSCRFDRKCRQIARLAGIDAGNLTDADKEAVCFLAMNIRHMSGGQRKLMNIFSNLVRYSFCDLLILDEPLNNLDYSNVRAFSNVLTRIYKSMPDLAVLLVTHCRSIPIVNRVISINLETKTFVEEESYTCNTCFGTVDQDGYYR